MDRVMTEICQRRWRSQLRVRRTNCTASNRADAAAGKRQAGSPALPLTTWCQTR